MSIPAFSDISKAANDLLNKDFYHTQAASLEVKSNAPNGVTFTVKGKQTHEGATSGSLEGKFKDSASGTALQGLLFTLKTPQSKSQRLSWFWILQPNRSSLLMLYSGAGVTLTETWSTSNSLDTKIELDEKLIKGLKAEVLTNYLPESKAFGAKTNLYFKQPNFHGRAFIDLLKGPVAKVDAVAGQDGFLIGAEAGYNVQKAAITNYAATVGYVTKEYSASLATTNNASVFSAMYYAKVNSEVEAGAKATWDSKAGNHVGLEVASKYRLDPTSFAKAKINDRGIACVAYNVILRPGFTLGLGASFDTQKLNEANHKVGASFTFSG